MCGDENIDISVVIKEYQPGFAGVSLRSDTIDVSELAHYLGGGGICGLRVLPVPARLRRLLPI